MALGLLAAGSVFLACQRKEKTAAAERDEKAAASFIQAHTHGVISSGDPVRIEFVNPVRGAAKKGDAEAGGLLEFSPYVKGKTEWADSQSLVFYPERPMKRGEQYRVTVHLEKLPAGSAGGASQGGRFEFGFRIMEQFFETKSEGLENLPDGNGEWQKLPGLLTLADGESRENIPAMLHASQEGRELPVRWEFGSEGREHRFVVDSLRRLAEPSAVILRWSGKPIGMKVGRADTVAIPAIGTFKVLSVSPNPGNDRFVWIRFSDPPQAGLDFRGLIGIASQAKLRFEAEGNSVKVFSSQPWLGKKTVEIAPGIRNAAGKNLENPGSFAVVFEEINPAVRFVGKGVILPNSEELWLPIEAVNLQSLHVEIVQVYADNIPQFLQINDLGGDYELRRVGRPVFAKTMALNPSPSKQSDWSRYTLDLGEWARKQADPGSLYRITLSFRPAHSTYPCPDSAWAPEEKASGAWDDEEPEASGWDGIETYAYDSDYRWQDRDNPCTPSYYRYGRTVSRNVLASNVGLMATAGGPGRISVIATDLMTALPLAGADVEALNYQRQIIATGLTDDIGFSQLELSGKPFLLRVGKGKQKGYLKLDDAGAMQMGQFDIGGTAAQQGLKGFLYGERGVWRPGDSLYLTFILEDKLKRLPPGQPVAFELADPRGRVVRSMTRVSPNGFYSFATATDADAPTGNYLARVKAGPAVFEEKVKVETVVPNRLKIKIDFQPKPLTRTSPVQGNMQVTWLSGAKAKNLRADVEMTLKSAAPDFPGLNGFSLSDPLRRFEPESQQLFAGTLDGEGKASFSQSPHLNGQAPGMLQASFLTRVMEAGGGFSVDRTTLAFHPYGAYVGIKAPPGDRARGMLLTDTPHDVDIRLVSPTGEKIERGKIQVTLYKVDWRWWWEKNKDDADYLGEESRQILRVDTVDARQGAAHWALTVKHPDWGRFLIRACDISVKSGGHCAGEFVYLDWPGWAGRSQGQGAGEGAAILAMTTDKTHYAVGEKARLTLPSPKGGRALISLEKGNAVLKKYWLDLRNQETVHEIALTAEMAPNVYVHVTVLQPHAQTENDMPIRLYNVVPLFVEDPGTRLHPVIQVKPEIFRPNEKAEVTVSEKDQRAMTYTVAIVDEGLLDLTRFPTPDPWDRFYAREALGVKTWDLYDHVAGAYGARLERLLSIGGDESGIKTPEGKKGNRFPPVVRFLGPFTLDKGQKAKHAFLLPSYVGSVRVMVVAGKDGAYGETEKPVAVRKPLMVLGTLPRQLAPGDSFSLPISVFAMEPSIRQVAVEVSVTGPLQVSGASRKTMTFAEPSDELIAFDLAARDQVGWADVRIKARSGGETAEQNLRIEIRNPNTRVTDVQSVLLNPGETWKPPVRISGVTGTHSAALELSRMPAIELGKHLDYLLQYPHGCVEQTVSSAFPQLYLANLMDLSPDDQSRVEKNVKAAIHRLRGFQTAGGGFGYWPGDEQPQAWSTNYAGHFLLEAEKKGYALPQGMLAGWTRFQVAKAQAWRDDGNQHRQMEQAYRLYALALAGRVEIGAMNRLKETPKLTLAARWQLGAAYFLAGQKEAARELVKGNALALPGYTELDGTFGTALRDKAMMLDVLCLLEMKNDATPLMRDIAESLTGPDLWSTQTTAFSLLALSHYAGSLFDPGEPAPFSYAWRGKTQSGEIGRALTQLALPLTPGQGADSSLTVANPGKNPLHARLIVSGIPALGQESESSRGLGLELLFRDASGDVIDPSNLTQGRDFVAEYRVVNRSPARGELRQLALSALFPSGWEIRNARLDPTAGNQGSFDYQDIRDDRVLTYFALKAGEVKVFRFYLNAAYLGHFGLPQNKVEAMYDPALHARLRGMPVTVSASDGD